MVLHTFQWLFVIIIYITGIFIIFWKSFITDDVLSRNRKEEHCIIYSFIFLLKNTILHSLLSAVHNTCLLRRIVRQTTTNRAFKCMAQQDLITTFVEATIHWRVINKTSLFHFQREIYHFVRLFFPFSLHFLYILDHTFKCHLFLSFDAPYRSTALMKVSLCGIW